MPYPCSAFLSFFPRVVRCKFSGLRIYPGRGIQVVRVDGSTHLFLNQKTKSMFQQRKKPAKLAWTAAYRRAHKKDTNETTQRRKRVKTTSRATRTFTSMGADVIKATRSKTVDQKKAGRDAAVREIKARAKKAAGKK